MSTADKLVPRTRSVIGGALALFASTALLAGCASAGPATEAPAETVAETAAPEPTAAPEGDEVQVSVTGATHDPAAATIEVRSIVTAYIGEGTCTISATSAAGEEVAQTVAALPDAQSTVCPTTLLEGTGEGEWTVVVSFEGTDVFGESEPTVAEAGA